MMEVMCFKNYQGFWVWHPEYTENPIILSRSKTEAEIKLIEILKTSGIEQGTYEIFFYE